LSLRKLGSIFWVGVAVIYCVVWYNFDQWGWIQAFAEYVVQPFLPENRDAYTGVTIMLWVVLFTLGGPARDKGKK
jgi:hypothetical protein